jgi:uridine kinase
MTDAFEAARARIETEMQSRPRLIAALEGGAAAGKTTLAKRLAAYFSAPVIAMDDFFLPPDMRTPERLSQPGGNIHFERFDAQVAAAVRAGRPIVYDVYDCHADCISAVREIKRAPLILVEGVYSLHPRYRDIYDLRFFLRTDAQTQDARLRARGPWAYQRFQDTWLPLEKAYFETENWEELCDLTLDT